MEVGRRIIGICMRIKRGFGTHSKKTVFDSSSSICSRNVHIIAPSTTTTTTTSSTSLLYTEKGNNWTQNSIREKSSSSSSDNSRGRSSRSGGRRRNDNLDSFGTWDSTTDLPLQVEASIASGKPIPSIGVNNVGVSSVKGRRTYNEDQFGIHQLNETSLYVAVFDGHGGDACAKFCATVLPKHLAYWLQQETDVPLTLHKSFLEVNNAYASWHIHTRRGAITTSSGSTATICLLKDSVDLYIGHVGDSRAILCRSGEARKITTDHEPTLITEKSRIERSGGRINENNRVNERLAMSRSIGDLELKRFGVIAVPDVISIRIDHSRDAFLVLTTDGINGVMTDNEIVEIVKQTKDPQYAATLLTETAFEYSSEDNNTALVIPLGSWGKYSAAATIFHSFGKSFTCSSRFS